MKKILILGCLLAVCLQVTAQNNINRSSSKATFKVKNLGVTVEGDIRGMYGEVRLNKDSSFVAATLDVRAIRTGIKLRDQHLQEPRFFDESKYPTITFQSSQISKSGMEYKAVGDLTIKDVTRTIEVAFHKEQDTFQGAFLINRKDFNVDNNEFITKGISDEVEVLIFITIDPS